MKHESICQLFDYWNERRGAREAPERSEIEPGAIRRALADTFILAFDTCSGYPFRIAGTRICAAFGRELKSEGFVDLWRPEDRALVTQVLPAVAQEYLGIIANARAESGEGTIEYELLILPLKHRIGADARFIGALAPVEVPYWFGMSAIGPLALSTHRYLTLGSRRQSVRKDATSSSPGRLARGFLVYEGGRS
jgi:hypothetical protein